MEIEVPKELLLALANALAFTGSSYLFHRLSGDNIDTERARHDAA